MSLKKQKKEEPKIATTISDLSFGSALGDILKKEYKTVNIFLFIFSLIGIGCFRSVLAQTTQFYWLFGLYLGFLIVLFVCSIAPFLKDIWKNQNVIYAPSVFTVIVKTFQVICFMIVLVGLMHFFDSLYQNHILPQKFKSELEMIKDFNNFFIGSFFR